MPYNNNNVATVLLLIALGVLIWYLTSSESSCDEVDNEEIIIKDRENREYGEDRRYREDTEEKKCEGFGNQNYIPFEMNSSNSNVSEYDKLMMSNNDNNVVSVINPSVDRTVNSDTKGFFEFSGDKDAASYAGIDDAFVAPLPAGVNPDVVDINKNNVTNYNAKDFLPKEINSAWFDTDFSQAKHTLNDDKLINTERYVIGINTVGESLKNASYDIRGTVPNPKFTVSPWNNSTYEPDYNIKSLC
jgi:hypothetical protein